MVGASLKSRSSVESCWFSVRTTPRSRGEDFKTQNRKEQGRIYRRSRDGWREKISRRRRRHFAAKEAAPPPYGHPGGGGGVFVSNTYDRRAHGFPHNGKLFAEFSTVWKLFSRFFHAMENFLRIFPQYGKLFRSFSTLWKTLSAPSKTG